MPVGIHAWVEDADNFDAFRGLAVKHDVLADIVFPVAFADVVTRPPLLRMNRQAFKSIAQIQNKLIGQFFAPSV